MHYQSVSSLIGKVRAKASLGEDGGTCHPLTKERLLLVRESQTISLHVSPDIFYKNICSRIRCLQLLEKHVNC
jgi:hypothetical protein